MRFIFISLATLLSLILALPAGNDCRQKQALVSDWWNYFARMSWPTWTPYYYGCGGARPWQLYNQSWNPQLQQQQYGQPWSPYGYGYNWNTPYYLNNNRYMQYAPPHMMPYMPVMNSVPVYLHKDTAQDNSALLLSPDARSVDQVLYSRWMLVGRRFCIAPSPTPLTSQPVYAYRQDKGNGRFDHFYTTNVAEIGTTTVGAKGKFGYVCLGVLGYVNSQPAPGLVPVYRWNSVTKHQHLFSLDQSLGERLNQGYKAEGVMGYTVQCPPY
jgi:hypothetical protein